MEIGRKYEYTPLIKDFDCKGKSGIIYSATEVRDDETKELHAILMQAIFTRELAGSGYKGKTRITNPAAPNRAADYVCEEKTDEN
jgi:hypothetical protein